MKKIVLLTCVIVSNLAFADQTMPFKMKQAKGTETGNGGDCVNIGEKCVPRDLLEEKSEKLFIPVSKEEARQFWMSAPGFLDLMNNITEAHPGLTLSIWAELSRANLYLVDWELDILPASETGMHSEYQADRQVCVRGENDIICSIPAYQASDPKVVWPLHEAFHAMFKNDISPVRHEKVRAFTKYLIKNQKKLQYDKLKEMMNAMGLKGRLVYFYDYESDAYKFSQLELQLIKALTSTKTPFESRCELRAFLNHGFVKEGPDSLRDFHNSFLRYSNWFKGEISDWGSYGACPNYEFGLADLYRKRFPTLMNALEMDMNLHDVTFISEYHPRYKEVCEEIQKPEYKNNLKLYELAILKGQGELLDAENNVEIVQDVDEAVRLNLRITNTMIRKSGILEIRKRTIREAGQNLPNGLADCEKVKKLVNRNWFEKFLGIGE